MPAEIERLAAEARGLCLACGVRADTWPFVPHVTLRRFTQPPAASVVETPVHWYADRLALIESGRHGHPGPYRVIATAG
ncbi:2'-5' RNA ligase family protein [Guyparkeria halopsychrophila]|uniref:2'-5' RNA ligase family protein n=1 Tax=Guyparkeria halopsychrophila TaxID=3139421 RepID=UPI0037CA6294